MCTDLRQTQHHSSCVLHTVHWGRQSREACLLEHYDGSKKVLGKLHHLKGQRLWSLVWCLGFYAWNYWKLFNNKISAALLQTVPTSEDLQTENLWCILLFTDAWKVPHLVLNLTAGNSNPFSKSNVSHSSQIPVPQGHSGCTLKMDRKAFYYGQILHISKSLNGHWAMTSGLVRPHLEASNTDILVKTITEHILRYVQDVPNKISRDFPPVFREIILGHPVEIHKEKLLP